MSVEHACDEHPCPKDVVNHEAIATVTVDGATVEVARSHDGSAMAAQRSPRPYLHPVRTPAGVVLTEIEPIDHPHHYGLSAAIADIDGTSHWGGPSYVAGEGYTMLADHGRQRAAPSTEHVAEGGSTLRQRVRWFDRDGSPQVEEDREIRFGRVERPLPAHLLSWHSRLYPVHDVTIGSPATRGRRGAGYGGLFWRLGPDTPTAVRARCSTGVVTGEQDALGAVGPWLTLTQTRPTGAVTLLLAQPRTDPLPWFVRTSGYVGAGPAIAWARPRPLARDARLDLHLWAALTDHELDDDAVETLYLDLETLSS